MVHVGRAKLGTRIANRQICRLLVSGNGVTAPSWRIREHLSLLFILNVIARRDAYINHADETRLNCGNAFFKYHLELGRFGHWANADGALHARHAGDVNVGIVQALADPAILYRPAAPLCHSTADGARR